MPTATETLSSGTPILDRQAPLPPRSAPGSGLAVVLLVWLGAVGIVVTCLFFVRPPTLRQWILIDFRQWLLGQWAGIGVVGFVLSALGAYYGMIAVHELGHVLAGLCVGFRPRSLRVGPLLFRGPFRVTLYRGPGAATNGVAELTLVATDTLSWRGVAMVLGGPSANILSGIAVLFLPFPITGFTGCFIAFSVVNGLSDLIPFESRLGVSDGMRIFTVLRNRARGERWLALLKLGGELEGGVLPELLSADALAKATAVREPSADTVIAHAIAYSAAFHQHQDREAGQMLETCLTHSSHAAPAVREALMSDAAVFQARRRKRADLAEQWLAAIPVTTQHPWFRSRAEAAIREANGDVAGAKSKLDEVETAILSFPENARRETLLRLLQRWKSDLCRC